MKVKKDILAVFKRVKPFNLFANDDLTPLKSRVLYVMSQAKKEFPCKVKFCVSRDGKVFMFLQPPNPNARSQRVFISSMQQLNEMCLKIFSLSTDNLFGGNSFE